MSAEQPFYETSFTVGEKYRVWLTMQRPVKGEMVNAVFEWEPHTPKRMTPHELKEYREKRKKALAEVSGLMGGAVLCVEV